jgi:hypothetical protein
MAHHYNKIEPDRQPRNPRPRVPFTPEEDELLLWMVERYGRKWTLLARLLTEHGYPRCDHSVANRVLVLEKLRNPASVLDKVLLYSLHRPWTPESRERFFNDNP